MRNYARTNAGASKTDDVSQTDNGRQFILKAIASSLHRNCMQPEFVIFEMVLIKSKIFTSKDDEIKLSFLKEACCTRS